MLSVPRAGRLQLKELPAGRAQAPSCHARQHAEEDQGSPFATPSKLPKFLLVSVGRRPSSPTRPPPYRFNQKSSALPRISPAVKYIKHKIRG